MSSLFKSLKLSFFYALLCMLWTNFKHDGRYDFAWCSQFTVMLQKQVWSAMVHSDKEELNYLWEYVFWITHMKLRCNNLLENLFHFMISFSLRKEICVVVWIWPISALTWRTLTLFLFGLSEFRKKNAGKKAAVPKGKGDEKGKGEEKKKKRKAEGEPSDKGDGVDDDQWNERGKGNCISHESQLSQDIKL